MDSILPSGLLTTRSKSIRFSSRSRPTNRILNRTRTDAHVALKILRADVYDGTHDVFELEILQTISRLSRESSNPGREHVLGVLNGFSHHGPNGKHMCLVSKILGCDIDHQAAQYGMRRLPGKVAKAVAKQLLMGLDFLHRECGVIHTGMHSLLVNTYHRAIYVGARLSRITLPVTDAQSQDRSDLAPADLKPSNILLEIENPEATIKEYLSTSSPRLLKKPDTEQAAMLTETEIHSDIPLYEVIPTPLISRMEKIHIRIIDFGVCKYHYASSLILITWR